LYAKIKFLGRKDTKSFENGKENGETVLKYSWLDFFAD